MEAGALVGGGGGGRGCGEGEGCGEIAEGRGESDGVEWVKGGGR